MDKDKLQELWEARLQAEQELERLRLPMTILFSDIKGSTAYAEKKGDVEYMAMLNRHNGILFPVIVAQGGRVVKTIGDAILAQFDDPASAVKAAAGMQRALAKDRNGREESEQIHIRIGVHHGLGLIKDNDVFGDVVNAASKVQRQADTEQVLITDVLLDAAQSAGFQCAKIGRAELKGKDEPIDLYAVAWSESATQQLIKEVQVRYERKLKDLKKQQEQLEEEFESKRDEWRVERRNFITEIEQLEESVERARQTEKQQILEDLQSELRFQLEEAIRSRLQAEQDLASAEEKFEREKNGLKAQITAMQAAVLEAMERTNNPSRVAMAVREQIEARVAEAKQEAQLQWQGERKRLSAEIERLKQATNPARAEEKKDAARRALLEKLGKLPAGSAAPAKTADQWNNEFQDAKIQWDTEREQLNLKIGRLERDLQRGHDNVRQEIFQEIRAQYEPKLGEANRERQRLEEEVRALRSDRENDQGRLTARIQELEQSIPAAQASARTQALAEKQSEWETRIEEANRLRSRLERKHQDTLEELESERRRAKKQITALEEELKEAKEAAYKAHKSGPK